VAIVASTVSSGILGHIAKQEGFIFEDTLTGFKYYPLSLILLDGLAIEQLI
jgi:hypothetical protein